MVVPGREIDYRILGPMELAVDGELVPAGSPQQRAVLAILLLNANKVVRVEEIISALWGDEPPTTALGQVQTRVWRLRLLLSGNDCPRAKGPTPLLTKSGGYQLEVDKGTLDLDVFKKAVDRARELNSARRFKQSVNAMRKALELWRGPALADIDVPAIQAEAKSLEELRLVALEERIDAELALGRHRELTTELRDLVAANPLREQLRGQLMLALYRSGRRAEALESFGAGYRLLVDNLGLEPTTELRELHHAILNGDPGLDVTNEIWVNQQPPRELPQGIPWFTGRDQVLADLRTFLTSNTPGHGGAVAAICGPPGVGKTALAVELGHLLVDEFPDGQFFVDMRGQEARSTDPSGVLARLLTRFGMHPEQIPDDTWDRAVAYRSRMAEQRALLVLDNADCEAQVRPLLPARSGCAVLITSQRHLAALESSYHVDLDVLGRSEALTLLGRIIGTERYAQEPDTAARIVELCGYLPLAICAAGARMRIRPHWPLSRFAALLADENQRLDLLTVGDLDVRRAFATSYGQLEPRQRRLFRRLGSLGSTEIPYWVAGQLVDTTPQEGEELIESLVEAKLIDVADVDQAGLARYRISDLLMLFARERIDMEDAAG